MFSDILNSTIILKAFFGCKSYGNNCLEFREQSTDFDRKEFVSLIFAVVIDLRHTVIHIELHEKRGNLIQFASKETSNAKLNILVSVRY